MDDIILNLFKTININIKNINELKGVTIERDVFLDAKKYDFFMPQIKELKQYLSSSSLTGLQDTAKEKQRFPLLNIVRQILKIYYLKMTPIRKADGYEKSGKKKYKRFYFIESIEGNTTTSNPLPESILSST